MPLIDVTTDLKEDGIKRETVEKKIENNAK